MFYPQAMTKVRLIIPSRDLMAVTKELADQGIFHLIDGNSEVAESIPRPADSWPEKAAGYSGLERRVFSLMTALDIPESTDNQNGQISLVEQERIHPIVDQIDQEVNTTEEKISDHQKRLEQLQNILDQLDPIAGLEIDLSTLRNPRYLHSILGVIPVANIDRLQTSLSRVPFVFLSLRQEAQRAVVWLAGSARNAEVLERAARSAYLNPLSLPESYHGTPSTIIDSLNADVRGEQQAIAELNDVLKSLRQKWESQLQELLWQIRTSRILSEAIGRYGRLRYTYIIMGWVPSGQVDEFSQRIWEVSKDILVETYVYKRGHVKQDVPVALHNPRILRPFQLLVTTYAQPRYEELDPTFLLAITFPLLFGAMFGDVGHGLLLLTLGSLLASRMIKALSGLASLGGIVAACGVSAVIFGLFYGNLFGFENIIPALVIRPVNSTLLSMVIAISMGVVLLSLGFIVNIINSWTRKDFAQLLFSPRHLPGLVLYLALVGVAAEVIMGKTPIPLAVLFLVALIAAVVAILSELLERLVEKHNPLIEGDPATFFVGAFFELFETLISLLSNSISFVRVAAFAVAHAGLSAVFFILANLVSPAHGTGYWVMVIIGNLFIVGFEGMIVAIQTMRLEYYEFFSKFFSGGGMRYEPLTLLPKAEK